MQIERHEIRVFSAVVEEGGFSRAGERLHISQSAVSQAIANLEHKLDTQLLVRKATPELTEAGIRLLRFTQTVINEERSTFEDIQQIRSGALSTLDLAMSSMVNRLFAKDLLLAFCERNPLTRLKLDVAPSKEIIYGVDDDRWELGFGPFQHRMPGHFVAHAYFDEVRVLAIHRNHPRADALLADPVEELRQTSLLTSYLDDAPRLPGGERLRDQFGSVWEVTNLDLRLVLAEAGMGVTYLSTRLLEELEGFVQIKDPAIASIERQVGLYYKKHKVLSEGAKRFRAICDSHFA
jgi:DNA-binding transcriptional LysR family regulator